MGDSHGPTIVVKVLKADKVRTNARGDAPDPMVKLRINVGRWPSRAASRVSRQPDVRPCSTRLQFCKMTGLNLNPVSAHRASCTLGGG
jgi:hypothetical protein